jgi:hypothetical protein
MDGPGVRGRVQMGAVVVGWLVTRAYLCTQLTGPKAFFYTGDVGLYRGWAPGLLHGIFPTGDVRWQYPPAAALFMVLPHLLPGSYLQAFTALALVSDAAVLVVLAWSARRRGSWLGCWYWIVGVLALGAIVLGRIDVFTTALAVVAVACVAAPYALGALAGFAAAVKLWPVALLIAPPPGQPARSRQTRAILAAVVVGGGVTLGYLLLTHNALGFLSGQRHRGVEFESVIASPFLVAKKVGWWQGGVNYQYGSIELVGQHVGLAGYVALAASVVAVALALLWRWRVWRAGIVPSRELVADAALVGTLLLVVTSRVLSPQYMLWLLGLAACCVAGRGSQRLTAIPILLAAPLTYLEYRVYWFQLVANGAWPVAILVVRNLLLVAAAVWGCWSLWRSTAAARVDVGDHGSPVPSTTAREA